MGLYFQQLTSVLILLAQFAIMALSSVMMLRTVERYLPVKEKWPAKAGLVALFCGTMGMPVWVGDENAFLLFPFFVGAFLACCRGLRLARLAMALALYAVVIPWSMMLDTLGVRADGMTAPERMIGLLCKFLLWAGVWLLARRTCPRGTVRLPRRMWALVGGLALAPVCGMLAFSFWGWTRKLFDSAAVEAVTRPIALTMLPFILLSGLALLLAVAVLARQEQLEQEGRLAQTREIYYQGLKREQEQVRTLRHDLRNHLAALQGLLEGGSEAAAVAYLHTLARLPALTGGARWCDNEAANAVLASKAAAARQQGLTADFQVNLPRELPVSDPDLCALLGNALDNAIEGAAGAADKRILLRARADKGLLMLRVENAYGGNRDRRGDVFATTKEDKAAHGLGLRGMREIAVRSGGSLEVSAGGGRFQLIACLPLGGGKRPG